MDEVIWKKLNNESNGKYEINNTGIIRNVITLKEKRWSVSNGCKRMSLIGKSNKSYNIHRLVAIYFIENPLNKPMVNHIDGNRLNNNIDNLEWCTASENMQHSSKVLMKGNEETHYKTTLTNDKVIEICKQIPFKSYRQLAKEFLTNENIICDIATGKSWTTITREFNYIPYIKKRKLTDFEVLEICSMLKINTYAQIANKYKVCNSVICEIAHGTRYKHVTKNLNYIPYHKNKNKSHS